MTPTYTLPEDGSATDLSSSFDKLLIDELKAQQNYIAQELHDALGSRLTAIALMLSGIKDILPSSAPAHQSINNVMQHVQVAFEVTRKLSRGLMALDHSEGALWRALESLCIDYDQLDGLRFSFDMQGDFENISEDAASHLYRIAQEAIANATRHARAQHIAVLLRQKGKLREMTISDNGSGDWLLNAASTRQAGLGLNSIRLRSRLIGARVLWIRNANNGTSVRVQWRDGETT